MARPLFRASGFRPSNSTRPEPKRDSPRPLWVRAIIMPHDPERPSAGVLRAGQQRLGSSNGLLSNFSSTSTSRPKTVCERTCSPTAG